MKEEISQRLAKAVQVYSNNTVLRVIVNAIPYIGGSLDVLLWGRGHRIAQERLKSLLEQLQTDMGTLNENMIDRTFIESEEWFDLVVKTLESAARTRDSEKIRLYSRILRNSVIRRKRETYSPEEYLTILAELTPREVELAKAIYAQQSDNPKENENELQWATRKGWGNLAAESGLDEKDVIFLLKRLERTGLIREVTGFYLGYEGGKYVITEAFRKLMDYLEKEP